MLYIDIINPVAGEGGWFVIFWIFKYFFKLNFIVLFPFLLKYYHIMFIIIVFWLRCDRPQNLFFSCPLCLFPHSRLSCILRRFLYLISFLLFPCANVWKITLAWVISSFPIAILNGAFFFRSVKAMNNLKRSAIKQILLLSIQSNDILLDFGGGWMNLHFSIVPSPFCFLLNEFHRTFSTSY